MRPASILAAAAGLVAATPALATGTILCRSTISPTQGPELYLVVPSGPVGIVQARFALGRESFTTGEGAGAPAIAQTWFDRFMLRLDIVDANAETRIVRLDTRRRRGAAYLGTLVHRGRSWQVRCTEEG